MTSHFDETFDHDDGLVHAHGWASSSPPGTRIVNDPQVDDDGHDLGLVHGHG